MIKKRYCFVKEALACVGYYQVLLQRTGFTMFLVTYHEFIERLLGRSSKLTVIDWEIE